MLSATNYAQNYAGIIGKALLIYSSYILVRPLLQLLTTTTISWNITYQVVTYQVERYW